MLIKSIKNSLKTLVYNPSTILFPVIFLIIINYLMASVMTAKTKVVATIIILCVYVLFSGFLAGWFNVIKKSYDVDKIKEKNYLSIFLEGFGKNIFPVSLGLLLFCLLLILVLYFASMFATKMFGSLDFVFKDPYFIARDSVNFAEYFKNLPDEKLYIIYCWQLCMAFASGLFSFLMLFFFPALSDKKVKNVFLKPFIALKNSIVFVFKHFFAALFIYVLIHIVHILIALINAFVGQNVVLSLILFFFYMYFIVFSVVLIFNYYDFKNNSSDRCDCIGENESCNSISKEN